MNLFKAFGALGLIAMAFSPPYMADTARFSKPELIVEWSGTNKLPTTAPYLENGAMRRNSFRLQGARNKRQIEVIAIPNGSDVRAFIKKLQSTPGVKSVEENQIIRLSTTSNDVSYVNGSLWGMYSDDSQSVGPSGTTNQFGSQAEQIWNFGFTGSSNVVIGVIDTGIDYRHPDLYLNIYLNQGEIKNLNFFNSLSDTDSDGLITFRDLNESQNASFVSDLNSNGRIDAGDLLADSRWEDGIDNDNNGYIDDLAGWDFVNADNDPLDDQYHGTHVAGTIGAIGGNSIGVVGINWRIQLMPLKFLDNTGSGYLSDAVQAIDYYTAATVANDRAFIQSSPSIFIGTNNSWGGGGFSSIMKSAIEDGANVNNYFIAAAGNSSSNNDSFPFYPSSYSTLAISGWEAVISVASLTSAGTMSSFSSYGPISVDIGAPGSGILSTTPNGQYGTLSGTSMATPHIAGSLAALAGYTPNGNRRDYRSLLLSMVTPTASLNGKVTTGGRLNIKESLFELANRSSGNTPSFAIYGPSTVDEGSVLSLGIQTTNLTPGTNLYWSITGIQSIDLTPNLLQGSVTVNNNIPVINLSVVGDNALEGPETLTFNLYSNALRTTLVATKSVTIADTSNGVAYFWGTTSRDILQGTNNTDVMTGVPSTGTSDIQLGKGQIDTVSGKGRADLFLLGEVRGGLPRVFYNNGVTNSTGASDYLLITDFSVNGGDRIQLAAGRYFSRNASTNTTLYWDRNNNGTLELSGANRDEVIAIFRGVNLGNRTITGGSVPWAIMVN